MENTTKKLIASGINVEFLEKLIDLSGLGFEGLGFEKRFDEPISVNEVLEFFCVDKDEDPESDNDNVIGFKLSTDKAGTFLISLIYKNTGYNNVIVDNKISEALVETRDMSDVAYFLIGLSTETKEELLVFDD